MLLLPGGDVGQPLRFTSGKSGFPFTSCTDLQIYAVTPIPDCVDVLQMDRVPDRVKSFYRVNNVRKFRYDRPFHKGPKDKENEFKVNRLESEAACIGQGRLCVLGTWSLRHPSGRRVWPNGLSLPVPSP